MKKWYLFDTFCAAIILLFSFLFQSFNVGYYSYGSFLGVTIGSIIVGVIRNRLNQKAKFRRSLVGVMLILILSVSIIKLFPIPVRDVGDVAMPYINTCINAFIYLFVTNMISSNQ
ncbi:hypothetical protein [Anoxybacteroides amylolyticum]|uniref:Putative membrane protein n=1 Tax=Anoxybacteroides amylolyticum TaxID=294699 RepID=A0A160F1J5_9BACL|nr:hypothetical protein [Anoxybacillus amylolyticus]ANB60017.1 putative membrane protein [Anoxybacillus amylolyticus]